MKIILKRQEKNIKNTQLFPQDNITNNKCNASKSWIWGF